MSSINNIIMHKKSVIVEKPFLLRWSMVCASCHELNMFLLSVWKVFKEHPLILNYEHLNSSTEDPWHAVVSYQTLNFTGNGTVLRELLHRAYPNTALLSMCLMFGCFSIAYYLRMFKNGTFLPGKVCMYI